MESIQIEGTWEEIAARADELTGHRLRVIVLPDVRSEHTPSAKTALSAAELLGMPAAERRRILQAQARLAESIYRSDPSLTDFETFGEDDFFDEAPTG